MKKLVAVIVILVIALTFFIWDDCFRGSPHRFYDLRFNFGHKDDVFTFTDYSSQDIKVMPFFSLTEPFFLTEGLQYGLKISNQGDATREFETKFTLKRWGAKYWIKYDGTSRLNKLPDALVSVITPAPIFPSCWP